MRNMKIKRIISLFTLALFSLPLVTLADLGTFTNPLGETSTIPQLLEKVLQLLIDIGIPVLVVFIVYAGFQFVTAQGNSEKITEARRALFWAVIGGAVLLGAQIISTVIKQTVESLK